MAPTRRSAAALTIIAIALAAASSTDVSAKKRYKPKEGSYQGPYRQSGRPKATINFRVGQVPHPKTGKQVDGVSLNQWEVDLKCPDGSKVPVTDRMTAKRRGKTFSSKTSHGSGSTMILKGHFTSKTKMTGTARVTTDERSYTPNCDTGAVRFTATYVNF